MINIINDNLSNSIILHVYISLPPPPPIEHTKKLIRSVLIIEMAWES